MIEWNETYATGEENIDRHHRELFKAVNRIEEQAEPSVKAERFARALHFLNQYAQLHFSYEERCMTAYHCAASEQNYQAHRGFLKSVGAFGEQHRRHGYSTALAREVHDFCEQWLRHHICKIDAQLRSVLPPQKDRDL